MKKKKISICKGSREIPLIKKTISSILHESAKVCPNQKAIISHIEDKTYTYKELNSEVNLACRALINLGAKKVIWLNKGIEGDDTHGHVDDIARFVKHNKVFLAYENNKKDKNFKNLDENFKILKKIRINSTQIKIRKIPMPKPTYINKIRVPASYLNFYIFNKFVLLPTFNDPKDKIVIKIFKKEFYNRKIIPIDCSELIWGFGAIHCLTQQEPE